MTDQLTGKVIPFRLYDEQAQIVDAAAKHQNVLILKSRQIGCSQICCFMDVMFAIMNPRAKIAIVADTEQKVHSLLDRSREIFEYLEIPLRISNRSKIVTVEGSEVHAVTANASKGQSESKAGRSMSFQMLHLSELAFWPDQDAFGALVSSAGLSAPILIESTSSGPNDLMWRLWTEKNDYKKLFFSVEAHAAYSSTKPLSEEEIIQAKELGFTKMESASWFMQTLKNRFQGDLIRMLREYPQLPEHAFMSSEGRWIHITPPVLNSTFISNMKVFHRREPIDEYVIGVDTSGGIGQDSSAIAVVSKRSGSLAASWLNQTSTVDELADQVRIAYQMYGGNVVVETNGIGLATVQACRSRGVPVIELKTSKASLYQGLLFVKQKVEEGVLSGPEELSEECNSLHINKYDKFDGKKDLCMAAGFCYLFINKNPASKIQEPEPGANVFSLSNYYGKKKTGNWSGF